MMSDSHITMPRFFTITTTTGKRFHMMALGIEDARSRFTDCKLGTAREIK